MLKQFYPLDAVTLENEIAAQRSAPALAWAQSRMTSPRARRSDGPLPPAVLQEAATDNFGADESGARLRWGPGYWTSSGAPIVRGGLGARPFFLDHDGGELLAPPPPAFGSAEYLAALAEIRNFSEYADGRAAGDRTQVGAVLRSGLLLVWRPT